MTAHIDKKPEIPKDLGLKVGSETEVFWTNVLKNVDTALKNAKNENMVNVELRMVALRKIKEEQRKAKV